MISFIDLLNFVRNFYYKLLFLDKIFPTTCFEDYHTFHTTLDEDNQEIDETIE